MSNTIPVSNYKHIAFSSKFRYLQVVNSGKVDYTIPSTAFGNTIVTIPHSLDYPPYFRVWVKYPSGKIYSPMTGPSSYESSSGAEIEQLYADDNNLYIQIYNESGAATGGSGTIYYRIYSERGL